MNDNVIFKAVGAVAGIGGIALAVLLLVYRDLIQAKVFPTLEPAHAALVIGALVVCTFFVAVFGIYGWLVNAANKFIAQKAWLFILLLTIMLGAVLAGIYMTTGGFAAAARTPLGLGYDAFLRGDYDQADRYFEAAQTRNPRSAEPWYWKARTALARGQPTAAKAFAREALERQPDHEAARALHIATFLFVGGMEMAEAEELARSGRERWSRHSGWITCLTEKRIFDLSFVTPSELNDLCPVPEPEAPV